MSFNGYNVLAPYYQFLVKLVYGDLLFTAQTYFLNQIPETELPKNILIIGGGTGELLLYCLERFPLATVCYVDSSKGMVKLTKSKLSIEDIPRVKFYNEDFLNWASATSFDFVLIPFVLDLLSEKDRETLLIVASSKLNSSGKLLVTDFRKGRGIFQSYLIRLMYWFFRVLNASNNNSLPDYKKLFSTCQLTVENEERFGKRILKEIVVGYALAPFKTK